MKVLWKRPSLITFRLEFITVTLASSVYWVEYLQFVSTWNPECDPI